MTTMTWQKWQSISGRLQGLYSQCSDTLVKVGEWLAPLGLRLILAWEFWESGVEKLRGENWFADIAERFPWPFSVVPPEVSWQMATWFEIVGALALLIGLGTRFFSLSLFVLTIVAIASVHWPESWSTLAELAQGYALTDKGLGNYKLPLIFLVMLWPLMLNGAGRLSLDAWLGRRFRG
ncbi:MAG: DoxX family protein [Delftia acidovorans]|nr:DoxX family protein [Delftia acidovorans]